MALDEEMIAAWREAASRLQIRVIAPFELTLPHDSMVAVEAFLPDFGGPQGMVAVAMKDDARCKQVAATELYRSFLGPDYRCFDDELFRETLEDWGWFGAESARPEWYKDGD